MVTIVMVLSYPPILTMATHDHYFDTPPGMVDMSMAITTMLVHIYFLEEQPSRKQGATNVILLVAFGSHNNNLASPYTTCWVISTHDPGDNVTDGEDSTIRDVPCS